MTLNWAIHRLNGISSPANALYSTDELAHQLIDSGAKFVLTCVPLLSVALGAAGKAGIPEDRVIICELPYQVTGNMAETYSERKTLSQFIEEGTSLPEIEPMKWGKGQGARQTAFLCYSSGTSGLAVREIVSLYSKSKCQTLTRFTERGYDIPPERYC